MVAKKPWPRWSDVASSTSTPASTAALAFAPAAGQRHWETEAAEGKAAAAALEEACESVSKRLRKRARDGAGVYEAFCAGATAFVAASVGASATVAAAAPATAAGPSECATDCAANLGASAAARVLFVEALPSFKCRRKCRCSRGHCFSPGRPCNTTESGRWEHCSSSKPTPSAQLRCFKSDGSRGYALQVQRRRGTCSSPRSWRQNPTLS
mmetsp:Transcript_41918/g.87725  ORF Transcript_41918/g.87725 Transcript_41918/m.87725 type:complete len:211 (-) Transcript_41918:667-1299(-)